MSERHTYTIFTTHGHQFYCEGTELRLIQPEHHALPIRIQVYDGDSVKLDLWNVTGYQVDVTYDD